MSPRELKGTIDNTMSDTESLLATGRNREKAKRSACRGMAAFRNKITRTILTAFVTTSVLTSCVNVDGVYIYIVCGRLLYEDRTPVDGMNVNIAGTIVDVGIIDLNTVPGDGYFSVSLHTGLAWGGEQFLGIRFYYIPVPPLIESIVFWLDTGTGQYSATVDVSPEMQTGVEEATRWVSLGDVVLTNYPEIVME